MKALRFRDAWERARATVSPLDFARLVLGFRPGEEQARILREAVRFRNIGLNCSRQWGKSTVVAVLAVHRLVMEPGVTVLVVGPAARQAGETVRKVREFLKMLGMRTKGEKGHPDAAVLPNGSRIIALPAVEATIRGYSAVGMLIIEEAARVPDEVCLALLPSLAVSGGDLIMASTPRGKRGFFFREMTERREGWLKHTGPVTECGRVPVAFLEGERARGEEYFAQEYMCQFVETGKYVFTEERVKAMENPVERGWRLV